MQKVLRKRVLRDLRANFFRYFALGLMIAMGIFLVVTIVGSAETLIKGTEDIAEETNLEDGEFEVFVPLTAKDKEGISDMGIDIEEHFYYDYKKDDESTVRIFKVRKSIDKIYFIEGKEPKDKNEIVIEKRYAEEHGLGTGDSFDLAGKTYKVSGIGVVSDYDGPFKEISDTSCNSVTFGLAFITDEAYQKAMADDPYDRIQKVNSKTEQNSINTYFVDAMVQEIMEDFQEELGYYYTGFIYTEDL